MKKIKLFFALALTALICILPLTAFCQENARWQYDPQEGVLEHNGVKYVPFDTMEYNVAIGEKIAKTNKTDSYGDYYVYSVKNVQDNDLVLLYNRTGDYCDSDDCYAVSSYYFAMLFCKEDKIEKYTQQIRDFKPSDNYCMTVYGYGCIAYDLSDELFNEMNQQEEQKFNFNNSLYRTVYPWNDSSVSVYDENHLFYARIGAVYVSSDSRTAYFCDFRTLENGSFTLGEMPVLGFLKVATFKNITGEIFGQIENAERETLETVSQIDRECAQDEQPILVSSTSVADFVVITAVAVLLLIIPLFVTVLSIIKLLSKKCSVILWTSLGTIALTVIALTVILMIIIL